MLTPDNPSVKTRHLGLGLRTPQVGDHVAEHAGVAEHFGLLAGSLQHAPMMVSASTYLS